MVLLHFGGLRVGQPALGKSEGEIANADKKGIHANRVARCYWHHRGGDRTASASAGPGEAAGITD
jgi:hypothetical protein